MSNEVAVVGHNLPANGNDGGMTQDQIDLIKRTIAKGATDDELKIFLHACRRTGLDPFARQIHAVKRWDSKLGREVMSIQTGIDGYRLIADRTGRYAPGPKPTFVMDVDGNLLSATAYVKKQTSDGTWHEVEAEAFYSDYVQTGKDGQPTMMWKKDRMMLAKCAEGLCLRKAFPAELSGIYTNEEMGQADNGPPRTFAQQKQDARTKIGELMMEKPEAQAADTMPLSEPPTPQVSDELPPAPMDDPTTPYRLKLKACDTTAQVQAWRNSVPDELFQDMYQAYTDAMKAVGKVKK